MAKSIDWPPIMRCSNTPISCFRMSPEVDPIAGKAGSWSATPGPSLTPSSDSTTLRTSDASSTWRGRKASEPG